MARECMEHTHGTRILLSNADGKRMLMLKKSHSKCFQYIKLNCLSVFHVPKQNKS